MAVSVVIATNTIIDVFYKWLDTHGREGQKRKREVEPYRNIQEHRVRWVASTQHAICRETQRENQ